MGHSSGAYNAAMLALDPRFLTAVGGSRDWLSGMIGLAGPYDFLPIYDPTLRDIFGPPEKFQDTQPIFHVDGENPPLLLMAGQDDEIVQAENTNSLRRAVVSAGGAVDVVMYPKMSHEKLVSSLATRLQSSTDVMAHVVEFINENTAGRGSVRSRPSPHSSVPASMSTNRPPSSATCILATMLRYGRSRSPAAMSTAFASARAAACRTTACCTVRMTAPTRRAVRR